MAAGESAGTGQIARVALCRGRRVRRAFLYVLSCVGCLLFCTGCPIVGALAHKAIPPIVGAKYVPAKEPMLVMAENFQAPADSGADSEQLVRMISDDLRQHEVAPQVDPVKAIDMRASDPIGWKKKSIAQIGRETGAKQVLYIDVVNSDLEQATASDYVRGNMAVKVRIVDVATGETRWPTDAAGGYPISVQTPSLRATEAGDEGSIREALQQSMADQISKLFYRHMEDE